MRGIDDTDREILQLLLEDARRPYSDIADRVGLSAPAVSDRVDRLRDIGLIERFTVDIDRQLLAAGVPVLVTLQTAPGTGPQVRTTLSTAEEVEYVFRTVDDRVVFTATVHRGEVGDLLAEYVSMDVLQEYDVSLLADTDWSPHVGGAELAPDCDECGNTVTAEGEVETIDGDRYHFCCQNCQERFVDNYRQLKEGV